VRKTTAGRLAGNNKKGEENSFSKKKVNKRSVDTHWRSVCLVGGDCCELYWRLACRVSRVPDTADGSFLVRSVILGEFACGCSNDKRRKSAKDTLNHLTPNGHYLRRTAQLTSRCCILYIY